jgi:hypothetical protein
MKPSNFFLKAGGTLWVIFAGVAIIMVLLQWLRVAGTEMFDWRIFAIIFGVGGVACFVLAGVLAIWEEW